MVLRLGSVVPLTSLRVVLKLLTIWLASQQLAIQPCQI